MTLFHTNTNSFTLQLHESYIGIINNKIIIDATPEKLLDMLVRTIIDYIEFLSKMKFMDKFKD